MILFDTLKRFILIQVSSKKRKVDGFLIAKLRSLIKIKKNKGPKTDPCGSPHSIFWWSELNPLIEAN